MAEDENPKRKRTPEDELSEFEQEFERMRAEMEGLMEKMVERLPAEDVRRLTDLEKSAVHGFSIRIDSGGKPVVREFGNMKSGAAKEEGLPISEEREPLIDVIESKGEVTVMAELPGVERGAIVARGQGRTLILSVNTEGRKYYKELELPASVDFSFAQAKYNNGVLEIILQKDAKGTATERIEVK